MLAVPSAQFARITRFQVLKSWSTIDSTDNSSVETIEFPTTALGTLCHAMPAILSAQFARITRFPSTKFARIARLQVLNFCAFLSPWRLLHHCFGFTFKTWVSITRVPFFISQLLVSTPGLLLGSTWKLHSSPATKLDFFTIASVSPVHRQRSSFEFVTVALASPPYHWFWLEHPRVT